MLYFNQVLNGYLSEIAPKPVQDTNEVREAKNEFFRVFNKALDGMIEAVFSSDTDEVREKKEAFVRTFDAAVDDLFETVEGFYTPEQVEARNKFRQAYQDASQGKIGAQYIEYTAEVKAARERFFEFFQFALDGMLYKLAPRPGYNRIPEQIADFYIKVMIMMMIMMVIMIADFYIKDDAEVSEAKESFDSLYREALAVEAEGEAAVEELERTLNDIAEVIEEADEDEDAAVDDGLAEDDDEEY